MAETQSVEDDSQRPAPESGIDVPGALDERADHDGHQGEVLFRDIGPDRARLVRSLRSMATMGAICVRA
jgi:hypothetical protein